MQQKAGTTNPTKRKIKPAVLAAVAILGLAAYFAARALFVAPPEAKAERDAYKLGTIVRITAYGPDAERLGRSLDWALTDGVTRLENELSVNIASSELSRINRATLDRRVAVVKDVRPDTGFLVARALTLSRETGGAFDPTIYPVVRLWGIGTDHAHVPTGAQIADERARVGWDCVSVIKTGKFYEIRIGSAERKKMALDLGGIAKGYVADVVAGMLRGSGVKCALIDLGGNIYAIGRAPQGRPWKLGIQHPDKPRGEYFGILEAEDVSVVTSGPYERFFIKNGVRYHHIFDPKTGRPASSDLASVSIVSRNSATADALCTALFVMGFDKSVKFLTAHRDVEAILLRGDRTVFITEKLKPSFTLADPSMKLETLK